MEIHKWGASIMRSTEPASDLDEANNTIIIITYSLVKTF